MNGPSPDAGLELLLELVRDFGGIDFPPGRRAGIERPIEAALSRYGFSGPGELAAYLADPANARRLERFVGSMTIGETHFFRNHPQVEAIRTVVLPEIAERNGDRRALRLWSAGCSTGEEAYSLAIAVDQVLGRSANWDVTILGTDINAQALERARQATYGEWSFRGVTEEIRQRYFTRSDGRFRVIDHVREMVRFQQLNLVDDRYPSAATDTEAMDLILCRNVLIYFRPETTEAVVERLERCLAPGGWMIAGHAESPMPAFRARFETAELPTAVLYRKRSTVDRAPAPQTRPWMEVDRAEADDERDGARASSAATDAADLIGSARARFAAGDRDGALALLEETADRSPAEPDALIAAARLLAGVLDYSRAEDTVTRALTRAPLEPAAHYVHALVLLGLERVEEAHEALRRTVYLDPGHVLAHFTLASVLDSLGRPDRAAMQLDRVARLLEHVDDDAIIDEHEVLTAGRLCDLAAIRRQLLDHEVRT